MFDEDDPYGEEDETTEANVREATVWIEGLDRINKALGGRGNGIHWRARRCHLLAREERHECDGGNDPPDAERGSHRASDRRA